MRPRGLQSARLLCPWGSPGKKPAAGCRALLQRSSRPRDGTASLACPALAGWFFTTSATFFNGQVRGFWQRRQRQPTPVLLPGESRGWRSLVGCSPWGCEELDMTERLHFPFSLSCIGEGNGKPLQCSCLENPRDGGAWWAAIYRVAQSQTQLKQLSSSSSFTSGGHSSAPGWPAVSHVLPNTGRLSHVQVISGLIITMICSRNIYE